MKNKLIQSLSGFGIFLVVIGHSTGVLPQLSSEIAVIDPMYKLYMRLIELIYTFHMPLFFCISGILFFHSGSSLKASWKSFITKKVQRLLVPYVAISTLVYPIKVIVSNFALRPESFGVDKYLNAIFIPWLNPIVFFWFLPTLFLIFIFSKLIVKKGRSIAYDVFILLVAFVLYLEFKHAYVGSVFSFMNIGGALHNFIFFFVGVLIAKYLGEILSTEEPESLKFTVLFFLALSFLLLISSEAIVLFFSAVLGIFISLLMVKTYPLVLFEKLGKYSYQIYLLSWFPQVFIRVTLGQIWFVNEWISVIFTMFYGLVVPILLVKFLERHSLGFVNDCLGIQPEKIR